jgi:hypothetical protein
MSTLRTNTLQTLDSAVTVGVADLVAIQTLFGLSKSVNSIAALRLTSKLLYSYVSTLGYYSPGDGGHSTYRYDSTDLVSADNGFTVIVGADGGRWKIVQVGTLNVKQAGAIAGVFDAPTQTINNAAFQVARDWVAANATRNQLDYTSGIYAYSVSPNWAIQNAVVAMKGEVRFRYFGTGNAIVMDAGPLAGNLCYNLNWGYGNRPIIECPSTAGHAMYARSVHHSKVGAVVHGAGSTSAGLKTEFAVTTEFDVAVTVNEEGWYLGSKPAFGYQLDKRLVNETTSYCTFPNPVVEGPDIGCHLVSTLGNIFNGGTFEACSSYGVFAPVGASGDRFIGTDFEANTTADVYALGTGIELISCDTDNQVNFGSTATFCSLRGGRNKSILVDTGSNGCTVADTFYNRSNNGGTMVDGGTASTIRNVRDAATNIVYLTGRKTFDWPNLVTAAASQTTVSVPGAKLGDKAVASMSIPIGNLAMTAVVSAADTVTVTLINLSGVAVDLGSGTLFCEVSRSA